MKEISDHVFYACKSLKRVVLNEGLEILGDDSENENDEAFQGVFQDSGVEKIVLPNTLRETAYSAFSDIAHLKTIYVGSDCNIYIAGSGISDLTKLVLPPETMAWGRPFAELRQLKELVVPDGVEKIGNYWFWGSDVEYVVVSAGVRELGIQAF